MLKRLFKKKKKVITTLKLLSIQASPVKAPAETQRDLFACAAVKWLRRGTVSPPGAEGSRCPGSRGGSARVAFILQKFPEPRAPLGSQLLPTADSPRAGPCQAPGGIFNSPGALPGLALPGPLPGG